MRTIAVCVWLKIEDLLCIWVGVINVVVSRTNQGLLRLAKTGVWWIEVLILMVGKWVICQIRNFGLRSFWTWIFHSTSNFRSTMVVISRFCVKQTKLGLQSPCTGHSAYIEGAIFGNVEMQYNLTLSLTESTITQSHWTLLNFANCIYSSYLIRHKSFTHQNRIQQH